MGAKAQGFHPVAPRCVRATRWGRASGTQGGLVCPSGGYGRNRATLANERARNRQRKARSEAPDGRGGYKRKRRSDRSGARSRIGAKYSGTGSEQKAPDRCRTSGDAGRTQTTDERGKAPCCVAASTSDARVSTWRKCGQVRNAKDPAPPSRRPARRSEALGDRRIQDHGKSIH